MLSTSNLTRPEKLIIWRRRNDLTQTAAAEMAGVTSWIYRLWEKGERSDQPTVKLGTLKQHEACFILRRRAGLSRADCARLVGISPWWLTNMERGRINPKRLVDYWK